MRPPCKLPERRQPGVWLRCWPACVAVLGLLLAAGANATAPDFSAIVTIEPQVAAPGKVSGLVRNIGNWTVRNVVLRVRHHWTWSGGGRYSHTDTAVVTRVIYPGDPAGFASVHIPPVDIPEGAHYRSDTAVLELTEIRIAPDL